jgi:hypothetical protein
MVRCERDRLRLPLVGGSTRLIEAILNTPELDAWPVGSDDSLAYDADKINHLPGFADE